MGGALTGGRRVFSSFKSTGAGPSDKPRCVIDLGRLLKTFIGLKREPNSPPPRCPYHPYLRRSPHIQQYPVSPPAVRCAQSAALGFRAVRSLRFNFSANYGFI
ncbi:hypothetical protein PFLUV_G00081130 [Perca fluviatilis]|uniref:Uncharacterized protein n=1 Tax=Perca fluviatilis TaxID=8168 RepID=A0A6A5F8E0_PERFL|nr:hypothetical protein PFLUV_G00081130 [Perca fluviatilis]